MMTTMSHLNLNSTVGDLPTYEFVVLPDTPTHFIAKEFEQSPGLPGVVISDDIKILGMIPRRRFYESLSLPYSREVFLKRPINELLDVAETEPLVLASTKKIHDAAHRALLRSQLTVYDPIIILDQDKKLLLDAHLLLKGQSQILTLTNQALAAQQEDLQGKQAKITRYSSLLEQNQQTLTQKNEALTVLQTELTDRTLAFNQLSQQFDQLNQQVLHMGRLLSRETTRVSHATFLSVNQICKYAQSTTDISDRLQQELGIVQQTTVLLDQVRATLQRLTREGERLAEQPHNSLERLSYVLREMGALTESLFAANTKLTTIQSIFAPAIAELAQSAQSGAENAQSLIHKMEQMRITVVELERFVKEREKTMSDRVGLPTPTLMAS
jgi:DNA repair exonuclease SbcCD ATPase subunit